MGVGVNFDNRVFIEGKKRKKTREIEGSEMIEEVDEKSMSKVQKIRSVLDRVESEEKVTIGLAMRLLDLFRMTIKISTDTRKKAQQEEGEEEKVVKKGKDKDIEIILSSNPALYKDVVKTAVQKLPKMIIKCLKEDIDLDTVTEENYKKVKKTFANAKKTQTILMRSFISNYLKLLKGGSEAESLEIFLASVVD